MTRQKFVKQCYYKPVCVSKMQYFIMLSFKETFCVKTVCPYGCFLRLEIGKTVCYYRSEICFTLLWGKIPLVYTYHTFIRYSVTQAFFPQGKIAKGCFLQEEGCS